MPNNTRGKTFSIFAVLVFVLLVSSTSIGFFLYNKEIQLRQQVESDLQTSHNNEMKLQGDLKEARRQLALAQDKTKEADEKINNLMDELDLNEGLRKELKTENASLKDAVDAAKKDKEKWKAEQDEAQKRYDEADKKYKEAQDLLKAEQDKSNALQESMKKLEEEKAKVISELENLKAGLKPYDQRTPGQQISSEVLPPGKSEPGKVNLDKIVVDPNSGTRGRVLSIDKETEFIVCNLGSKHGLKNGDILSVYRGEEYLGDVKVSRVQDELSAADIIPPFSSRTVRKNDVVVFKP